MDLQGYGPFRYCTAKHFEARLKNTFYGLSCFISLYFSHILSTFCLDIVLLCCFEQTCRTFGYSRTQEEACGYVVKNLHNRLCKGALCCQPIIHLLPQWERILPTSSFQGVNWLCLLLVTFDLEFCPQQWYLHYVKELDELIRQLPFQQQK